MQEGRQTAEFRFYEELNDVLPAERRRRSFAYAFLGAPAIKDAIEALGVPHTEVDLILVNGVSVGFDYRLHAGDCVSVYPVFESLDIGPVTRLRPRPLREPKFICDVHLGKLARRLRLLGFDVAYRNTAADPELVETALAERRTILTQDRGILKLKRVTHGYLVRSPHVREQVAEVLTRFDLGSRVALFSRCTLCNGLIQAVDKADVQDVLPPKTREYYDEFFRCEVCGKVYWKGSHFRRMEADVRELMSLGAGSQDRPAVST
jgi:uncharacterized protein with PIN domain